MPTPLYACTFDFSDTHISLIASSKSNTDPYRRVVAKAPINTVLESIMGVDEPALATALGILPRGLRFVSANHRKFVIEYQPGAVQVKLPKWAKTEKDVRLLSLWMPKHFLCIEFSSDFTTIVNGAVAISYGYNYLMTDQVQTLFTMSDFMLNEIPTNNLKSTYGSVGDFLPDLQSLVFGHAFSLFNEDVSEINPGDPSLPIQFTKEKAKKTSFFDFWAAQEHYVEDWTFEDPHISTLQDIMALNNVSIKTNKNYSYSQIIHMLQQSIIKHNELGPVSSEFILAEG